MKKIIDERGCPCYGLYDEPVEWNYKDFILRDFFDKPVSPFKKKRAYHQFNFIAVTIDPYIFSFCMVDLGVGINVFVSIFQKERGILFEHNVQHSSFSKVLDFKRSPDAHISKYKEKDNFLKISKDLQQGELIIDCALKDKFTFFGRFDYSFKNKPLRVLNPSDPSHFTFTEKCGAIGCLQVHYSLNGVKGDCPPLTRIKALYDWSGGYLRAETNWYWAALTQELSDGRSLGLNFAALTNESYFAENAIWVDQNRERVDRLIFDFKIENLNEPWHIYTEDKRVDLIFTPIAQREKRINRGPFFKTLFNQFVGEYSGILILKNQEKIHLDSILGFGEYHKAKW